MALQFLNGSNNNAGDDGRTSNTLWVFGYGSLVWNPGFKFTNSVTGYIQGYSRRFWQGNTVHRGTPGRPGRVATLVEDPEGLTWGTAYELEERQAEASMSYLENRESVLGGYRTTISEFYTKDGSKNPFPVLLYMATSDNANYMGPASLKELANQIVSASGACGHNVEYVIRLADFMRDRVPEVNDEHLYLLEEHVRMKIKERKLNFQTLMGPNYEDPAALYSDKRVDNVREELEAGDRRPEDPADGGVGNHDLQEPVMAGPEMDFGRPRDDRSTFLYASRVPPKKLRCLNV